MQILVGMYLRKELPYQAWVKGRGARTLIAGKIFKKWFFIFGFVKNEKDNINDDELIHLQAAAHRLLSLTDQDIEEAILAGELKELTNYA